MGDIQIEATGKEYEFEKIKTDLHKSVEEYGFDWNGPKVWREDDHMACFYSKRDNNTGKKYSVKFITDAKTLDLFDTQIPYVDKIQTIVVFFEEDSIGKDKTYQQTISLSPEGVKLGTFTFMVSDYAKENGHTSFNSLSTIQSASKFEGRGTVMPMEEWKKYFSNSYDVKNINFSEISDYLTNPDYINMWNTLKSGQMSFDNPMTVSDTYNL